MPSVGPCLGRLARRRRPAMAPVDTADVLVDLVVRMRGEAAPAVSRVVEVDLVANALEALVDTAARRTAAVWHLSVPFLHPSERQLYAPKDVLRLQQISKETPDMDAT